MGDRSVATCYRVWCGGGLRGWRCEQMAVRRGWNATPAAAYSPGGRRNHGHGQVTIAEDDVLTREGLQAFSNRWPCLASKTPGDTYNS